MPHPFNNILWQWKCRVLYLVDNCPAEAGLGTNISHLKSLAQIQRDK